MRICVIDADLRQQNILLQPQRYMYAVCRWLMNAGEEVLIVSDGYPSMPRDDRVGDLPVRRVNHVRYPYVVGNRSLSEVLSSYRPDILLWHIGLTSLLHLRFRNRMPVPTLGILSSPIYRPAEVAAVGWGELARNLPSYLPHIVGSFLPKPCPKWLLGTRQFDRLVVMTEAARHRLAQLGFPERVIHVVPAGVDKEFLETATMDPSHAEALRTSIGISPEEFMVVFAGSPEAYRGLTDILEALPAVLQQAPRTRLVALCRPTGHRAAAALQTAQRLCRALGTDKEVTFTANLLSRGEVVQYMRAADAVVLPFRLVASGLPVALLEALALGTPVIATDVGGMHEFVNGERGFVVPPHSPSDLAKALSAMVARGRRKRATYSANHGVRPWTQVGEEIHGLLCCLQEQFCA